MQQINRLSVEQADTREIIDILFGEQNILLNLLFYFFPLTGINIPHSPILVPLKETTLLKEIYLAVIIKMN